MSLLDSTASSPLPDQEVEVHRHHRIPRSWALERPLLKGRSRTRLIATSKTVFPQLTCLIGVLAVVFVLVICFRKSRKQRVGAAQRRLANEEHSELRPPGDEHDQTDLCQSRDPDVEDGESDGFSSGEGEETDEEDLYSMPPTTFYSDPEGPSTSASHRGRHHRNLEPLWTIFPHDIHVPLPTKPGAVAVLEEPRDASDIESAYDAASLRANEAIDRSVKTLDVMTSLLQEGFQALLESENTNLLSTPMARYVSSLTVSLEAQVELSLIACARWAPLLSRQSVLDWVGTIILAQNSVSDVRSMVHLGHEEAETSGLMGGMLLELQMIFRMHYVHHELLLSVEKLFEEGLGEVAVVQAHLANAEEMVQWFRRYQRMRAFHEGTFVHSQLLVRERKLNGVLKTLQPVISAFEMWGENPRSAPLRAVRTHLQAVSALLAIHSEYPDRFVAEGLVVWLDELKRVVDALGGRPRRQEDWRSTVRRFLTFYFRPCGAQNAHTLRSALLEADALISRVEQRLKSAGVRFDPR